MPTQCGGWDDFRSGRNIVERAEEKFCRAEERAKDIYIYIDIGTVCGTRAAHRTQIAGRA